MATKIKALVLILHQCPFLPINASHYLNLNDSDLIKLKKRQNVLVHGFDEYGSKLKYGK